MLIVLSGASSSGKTTLARAIVAAAERPILHFEADSIVRILGFEPDATDLYRAQFIFGLHESIAALGRSLDVVVDGSLPNEAVWRDRCLDILRRVPGTRVIAVHCSIEVLRRREAVRSDRVAGWAETQAHTIHENQHFDLQVDTSTQTAEDAAKAIVKFVFG